MLTEAILNGDVIEAKKQAEILARMKEKLTIQFLESNDMDDNDVDDEKGRQIELNVKVIDCDSLFNGQIQIFVENLKRTSIKDLKRKVVVMIFLEESSHLKKS